MKNTILLLTILFCCVLNAVAQEQIESEEYHVYKVFLEEFITPQTKNIVITKFSTSEDSDNFNTRTFIRRKLSQVEADTVNCYFSRNRKSYELSNNFGINVNISLITEEDLIPIRRKEKADLGEAYLEAFKEKFSTDYNLSFSRVGFNRKMSQALIHFGYSCGTTCGQGNYVFLSKKNNRWTIKKKVMSWIS